MTLYKRC